MAVASGAKTGSNGWTPLNIGLWAAQVFICVAFCMIGFMKFTWPIPRLSALMAWTGQLPEPFVRFIGLVDFAGGLGVFLPAVTRIMPRLTVVAALCCTVLQVLAICFHVSRGEARLTPMNFVFLALVIFILWGRSKKSIILPR